jgi:hypothetical protein
MQSNNFRKVRLSALERDMLLVLEEAGEENLTTLVNMLPLSTSTHDRKVLPEISEMFVALRHLLRLRFVSLAWRQCEPTEVESQLIAVESLFRFDPIDKIWRWDRELGGKEPPSVVLEPLGKTALRK